MPNRPLRTPSHDARMPVIVGFGGIDAAGRWGGPPAAAFESMVHDRDVFPDAVVADQLRLMERCRRRDGSTWDDVAENRVVDAAQLGRDGQEILRRHLFLRRVPFGADRIPALHRMNVREMVLPRKDLPRELPSGWTVADGPGPDEVRVRMEDRNEVFAWSTRESGVSTSGGSPEGFQPYPEEAPGPAKRRVPRGIWIGLWAVNDALKSSGISFDEIRERVPQDRVGVYFASAMGQVGPRGFYGYIRSHIFGERPQSTHVPFSLTNTPGAFVAAYSTGSVGHISSDGGACATFMLNLHNAMRDIRAGRRRFAIVGACDAAIYPWTIAGYDVMHALARDEDLEKDENGAPIHALASRPFGRNRLGFVMGEGGFCVILTDRELALEMGLRPRGLVCDVTCHSDGWKKSISGPGIGDYPALHGTLASLARTFGIDAVRRKSFVSAHGSSTPQNGITEAALYRAYAEAFDVPKWRITAPKSFVGHSMGAAGGAQSIANILSLERGILPRIRNLDRVGVDPDLEHPALDFLVDNHEFDPAELEIAIGVSKGFGGFNVTQAFTGPRLAEAYVLEGADAKTRAAWERAGEKREERVAANHDAWLRGSHMIDYDSSKPLTAEHVKVTGPGKLEIEGYRTIDFGPEDF